MEKIHLFFFVVSNNSTHYGIGTYLNNLVSALADNDDYQVTLVHCLDEDHRHFLVEQEDNLRHIYIPKPSFRYINLFGQQSLSLKNRYAKRVCSLLNPFLSGLQSPILHFNQSLLAFLAEELKANFQVKIVFTVHFLSWQFLYEKSVKEYATALEEATGKRAFEVSIEPNEKTLCQIADQVICLTDYAKRFVSEAYDCEREKVNIIKNGIELSLPSQKNVAEIKASLGFSPNDIILLSVGRVVKSKGIEQLLVAMDRLVNHYGQKHIKLVVVGAGSFDQFLPHCQQIWNQVIWTGSLAHNKLQQLYSVADIGITTSFFEQCSYTVLEMLSHKLPIIYTNHQGLNEMLEDGHSGLSVDMVFDPEKGYVIDVDAVCSHLMRFLGDRNSYDGISKRQRSALEEEFELQRWIDNTKMVYKELSEELSPVLR